MTTITITPESLTQEALEIGADRAAPVDPSTIRLHREVRQLCEANSCGQYGRNWKCPPHVGSFAELSRELGEYDRGVIVQTVGQLEDSYDIENMGATQKLHQKRILKLARALRERLGVDAVLALGAGPCDICPRCTLPDGEPCRLPDQAIGSMEAYGMNVKDVVESCGLPYISGPKTVTYSGMLLYRVRSEG